MLFGGETRRVDRQVNVLGYMTGRPSPKMDLVEGIKAMKKGKRRSSFLR
jgi:hypothetical protein